MGAFDGLRIPYDNGFQTTKSVAIDSQCKHFPTQSSFDFFNGFGIDDLKRLLVEAETMNNDVIWVPNENKSHGSIALKSWYIRALINEHFGVK